MKRSENEKIDIKLINESDLIGNKKALISLLEENLKINFTSSVGLKEFAASSYENMVQFNKDSSAILIGAFKENIIIGFLWAYKKELLGERRIHINHIVVNSAVRTSGIGSRLMTILEDIARDKGVFKIELMTTANNEDTMAFYKAKGFSMVRVQLEKELGETNGNR